MRVREHNAYTHPVHALRFMDELGYYISSRSFKGPYLAVADIRAMKPINLLGINLYCVKKELTDAFRAGKRGSRRLLREGGGDNSSSGGEWRPV